MDKYADKFSVETGCQLEIESLPNGSCLKAVTPDGKCVGSRQLTNSQLKNTALVQAVMADFIAQTERPTDNQKE